MAFRTRLARIGYVLGTALAVAAILYFFSSNWGGLPRGAKTLLAACMTAGFYALAFVPAALPFWRKHGDYLPLVFLCAGVMAFGGTVALLNGIYNAHADEWRLFAVWFVPAVLFSLLLRNVWFYALTYVIGHLAIYFLFYPGTYYVQYTDWQQAGIFGLFGAINLLLYAAAERGWWRAAFLKPASLAVFLAASVWLSNSFVLNAVGRWLNLLSVAILAACFYGFGKRRDSLALSLTGLGASFYAVLKFLELMEKNFSELFFFFGLVFVALLLTGNVLFFRYVARLGAGDGNGGEGVAGTKTAGKDGIPPDTWAEGASSKADAGGHGASGEATGGRGAIAADSVAERGASGTNAGAWHATAGTTAVTGRSANAGNLRGYDNGTAGAGDASGHAEGDVSTSDIADSGSTAARVIGNIVTIVGTVVGTVSLVGLLMLAGESWDEPGSVVFAVSVLLIAAMAFLPRLHPTVRNTGIMIGLLAGNFSIFAYQEARVNAVMLILGILCWFRLQGTGAKLVAHFIIQLTFVIFGLLHLEWYGDESAWILLILAAANGLVYALHERVRTPSLRRPLELGSPLFMLTTLFWLTFLEDVFAGSHALFNVVYFVLVSGLLISSVRRKRHYDTTLSMAFWLLFVGFKYYDWLWDLLHKSLTMLLGGVVLIAVSALLDRSADRGKAGAFGASGAESALGEVGAEGSSGPDGGDGTPIPGDASGASGVKNTEGAGAPQGTADAGDGKNAIAANKVTGAAAGRPNRLLPYRRLATVLAILALQSAYIGGEIAARESLIARGTTVQLAVHPEDWVYYRSGQATWVRYTISELPEPMAQELRENGMTAGKRIRLVLSPDAEGVYQIDRFYQKGETVRPGEVVINGRFDGWGGVRYGIESRDPDREGGKPPSRIVDVRISANGNAMLAE